MRLGKRERGAVASKRQRKASIMARNAANSGALAEAERLAPSLNDAYSPNATKLTAQGRGRVMYNIQGSSSKRKGKTKDVPVFDTTRTASSFKGNGLGSVRG